MCVLSIKVPIRKKSGNLFNDPRVYIHTHTHTHTHKGQLKSLLTDKDIPMECDQMRFIFQLSPLYSPHTSSIGVAVFGSH